MTLFLAFVLGLISAGVAWVGLAMGDATATIGGFAGIGVAIFLGWKG